MRTALLAAAFTLTAAAAFAAPFTATSASIREGQRLDDKQVANTFGCNGKNVSPQVSWKDAPAGTLSYAVTLYDPDATTGSGWWHWTAFNITNSASALAEGGPLPAGAIQGRTDYGTSGLGGACPPPGDKPHRYVLTVWALKVATLPLTAESPGAQVGYYVRANALASSSVTGVYSR